MFFRVCGEESSFRLRVRRGEVGGLNVDLGGLDVLGFRAGGDMLWVLGLVFGY